MKFRPGTADAAVYREVMSGEYGQQDFQGKVVLDIGAHIGSFTVLAAAGGAKKVVACEPGPENFRFLTANTRQYPQVVRHMVVVWRSDVKDKHMFWAPNKRRSHTSMGGVWDLSTRRVQIRTLSLDALIESVGQVDLLKIDCEGSEYPILMTATKLSQVQKIVGEYHSLPTGLGGVEADASWEPVAFFEKLKAAGFNVSNTPHKGVFALGTFVAVR